MKILERVQSLEGGIERCKALAECSLFVCNKWDRVEKCEREKVKTHVIQELRKCWPDDNLNSQVVYMSILEAIKLQQYGGVTEDFIGLLKSLQQMIQRAIGNRLFNHWQ
jgi:GTP-binding protein EngB required for normal cell division